MSAGFVAVFVSFALFGFLLTPPPLLLSSAHEFAHVAFQAGGVSSAVEGGNASPLPHRTAHSSVCHCWAAGGLVKGGDECAC